MKPLSPATIDSGRIADIIAFAAVALAVLYISIFTGFNAGKLPTPTMHSQKTPLHPVSQPVMSTHQASDIVQDQQSGVQSDSEDSNSFVLPTFFNSFLADSEDAAAKPIKMKKLSAVMEDLLVKASKEPSENVNSNEKIDFMNEFGKAIKQILVNQENEKIEQIAETSDTPKKEDEAVDYVKMKQDILEGIKNILATQKEDTLPKKKTVDTVDIAKDAQKLKEEILSGFKSILADKGEEDSVNKNQKDHEESQPNPAAESLSHTKEDILASLRSMLVNSNAHSQPIEDSTSHEHQEYAKAASSESTEHRAPKYASGFFIQTLKSFLLDSNAKSLDDFVPSQDSTPGADVFGFIKSILATDDTASASSSTSDSSQSVPDEMKESNILKSFKKYVPFVNTEPETSESPMKLVWQAAQGAMKSIQNILADENVSKSK